MTTGVTCTVLIDGVRAADGSPGDDLLGPVVLDDLAVTWGRSDTMSQPEPDACTFQVMDQLGGQAFMAQFRTGARVDVVARGETYPDPSTPTFVNPGFETAEVTWSPVSGTATRSTARPHVGAYALALKPNAAGTPASILLAPGVFQAPGTNPDAWDAIPTTAIGQTWSSTVDVWIPPGASVTVRAALFSGPYAAAGAPAGTAQIVPGDGTWQTVTASHTLTVNDRWVGVQLVLNPTGPAWDEMPPTLTWDGVDPTLAWDDLGTLWIDQAQVTSPASGSGRGVLVFSGRITDLAAKWDTSTNSPVVDVTATGFTADLENRNVGEEPWSVESVDARAHRILELAGLPIDIDIDTSIDELLLSWRDVDSQGATGLLREIATSVDGVLWPAVHQSLGAYLRLEDPSLRASLLKFDQLDGPPAEILHTNLVTNPDAEAYGAVATVGTNWVLNPAMGTNANGYAAGGAGAGGTSTGTRTAGAGFSGGYAWVKTWSVPPTSTANLSVDFGGTSASIADNAALPASTLYTAQVRFWTNAPGEYNFVTIERDAAGANVSVRYWRQTCVSGWNLLSVTTTSVATTAAIRLSVAQIVGALPPIPTTSTQWRVSEPMIERVGFVAPYYDGSTPAAGDFIYAWSGTAHASTSNRRAPNIAGASAYGAPARWSSVVEHDGGVRSWAFLPVAATPQGLILNVPNLTTGQTITAVLRVKGPAGLPLQLQGRTSTGGGTTPPTLVTCTGAWQTVTFSTVAVAGTTLNGIQFVTRNPYGVGTPFYVDRAIIVVEPTPYAGPYFDGRTPSTDVAAYAWTGAADASTSTWSTVQTHTIVIVQADPNVGFDLSACVILRDPVTWVQDVSDVVTRVAATWKVQGVDDEGNPTTSDATVTEIDAELEVMHGTRRVSISTQLQAAADAIDVAQRILSRANPTDWRADGLTIDDDDVDPGTVGTALVLDMLDGTSRIGAPIVLNDLPIWSPSGSAAGVYLEGGTYRFVGGRWVLELLVSSATGLGDSAEWDQLDPTWAWDQWDPAITWNELRGVAAPTP